MDFQQSTFASKFQLQNLRLYIDQMNQYLEQIQDHRKKRGNSVSQAYLRKKEKSQNKTTFIQIKPKIKHINQKFQIMFGKPIDSIIKNKKKESLVDDNPNSNQLQEEQLVEAIRFYIYLNPLQDNKIFMQKLQYIHQNKLKMFRQMQFFKEKQKYSRLLYKNKLLLPKSQKLYSSIQRSIFEEQFSQIEIQKFQFFQLMTSPGSQLQPILEDARKMTLQIIKQKQNHVTLQYYKCLCKYKKLKENLQNIEPVDYTIDSVQKILQQGIQQAIFFISPIENAIHGFNLNGKIFINIHNVLHKIWITLSKNNFEQKIDFRQFYKEINKIFLSQNQLIISYIQITILHQLAHYMIRKIFNQTKRRKGSFQIFINQNKNLINWFQQNKQQLKSFKLFKEFNKYQIIYKNLHIILKEGQKIQKEKLKALRIIQAKLVQHLQKKIIRLDIKNQLPNLINMMQSEEENEYQDCIESSLKKLIKNLQIDEISFNLAIPFLLKDIQKTCKLIFSQLQFKKEQSNLTNPIKQQQKNNQNQKKKQQTLQTQFSTMIKNLGLTEDVEKQIFQYVSLERRGITNQSIGVQLQQQLKFCIFAKLLQQLDINREKINVISKIPKYFIGKRLQLGYIIEQVLFPCLYQKQEQDRYVTKEDYQLFYQLSKGVKYSKLQIGKGERLQAQKTLKQQSLNQLKRQQIIKVMVGKQSTLNKL